MSKFISTAIENRIGIYVIKIITSSSCSPMKRLVLNSLSQTEWINVAFTMEQFIKHKWSKVWSKVKLIIDA